MKRQSEGTKSKSSPPPVFPRHILPRVLPQERVGELSNPTGAHLMMYQVRVAVSQKGGKRCRQS